MAGVSDKGLSPLYRFPAGLNNIAPEQAFPRNENGGVEAFAAGQNVDVDDTGRIRRARGHEVVFPGEAHSLHARQNHLLGVVDRELCAFVDGGAGLVLDEVLLTGFDRFTTFATDDDESTFWSDGVRTGRIDPDLGTHPIWVGSPDPPELAAIANGAMAAGSYEVSLTVTDADGRESGASNPVVIQIAAGGGISVQLPAPPADAARWRVYVSAPDGDVQYLADELPISAPGTQISNQPRGKQLETAWLFPLMPCTKLVYAMGRLFGLHGANTLIWSEPYRLGLMHPDNWLRLGQEATLLEAVGEGSEAQGLFIADHKRTYWLAGADPKRWQQIGRRSSAVVPGSSLTAPGTVFNLETEAPVAFWVERSGVMCLGLPGGNVIPLRQNEVGLPLDSERGAAGFFAFDGVQQIVASMFGGYANPLVGVRDRADATIRRNGVEF